MHHVKIRRQKWFACACCPPNLARIVASLGNYVHSIQKDALYTHLYIGSEAKINLGGEDVSVKIETQYPWEGQINISFAMKGKAKFKYGLRIPAWCGKYSIRLNNTDVPYSVDDGFALIDREWSGGDKLSLVLDMPVNFLIANPHVRENTGKTAVMRGPIVYCAEEEDNGGELFRFHVGNPLDIAVTRKNDLLEGITTISFTGKREKDWAEDTLYRSCQTDMEDKKITLIPYYAWANRNAGEMAVWLNR